MALLYQQPAELSSLVLARDDEGTGRVARCPLSRRPFCGFDRWQLRWDNALAAGRFDMAARAAHQVTELEPELIEARAVEAFALILGGRAGECVNMAFGAHEVVRALCRHAVGRPEDGRALVDSVLQAVGRGERDTVHTEVVQASDLATYFAYVGDVPSAVEWLDRAFALSPMGIEERVLGTPLFDSVRADPEGRARLEGITAAIWPRVERARRAIGR